MICKSLRFGPLVLMIELNLGLNCIERVLHMIEDNKKDKSVSFQGRKYTIYTIVSWDIEAQLLRELSRVSHNRL